MESNNELKNSLVLKQVDKSGQIRLFQKVIITFEKLFLFQIPMNIQKGWKAKLESAYSMKRLGFKFGHNIFTGFKSPRL